MGGGGFQESDSEGDESGDEISVGRIRHTGIEEEESELESGEEEEEEEEEEESGEEESGEEEEEESGEEEEEEESGEEEEEESGEEESGGEEEVRSRPCEYQPVRPVGNLLTAPPHPTMSLSL